MATSQTDDRELEDWVASFSVRRTTFLERMAEIDRAYRRTMAVAFVIAIGYASIVGVPAAKAIRGAIAAREVTSMEGSLLAMAFCVTGIPIAVVVVSLMTWWEGRRMRRRIRARASG